jgi:murein DD-endopeptidase MepM/ murein hydrolase activator NlpD
MALRRCSPSGPDDSRGNVMTFISRNLKIATFKIINAKQSAIAISIAFAAHAQAQIPNQMIMPVDGLTWYNSPGSPAHTGTGGIGGADDSNALDLNLASDADRGRAVYATADGWIERNLGGGGWGGNTYGQLLLKHRNPDGTFYYCGYLHLSGITSLKATQGAYVRAGTVVGSVSNVSPTTGLANHLHFACYTWDGTRLRSRAMSVGGSLLQVASRPNIGLSGSVSINGSVVNASPFPISRNSQFQMYATFRNSGTTAKAANYYAVLTRDQNGADFVGSVGSLNFCLNLNPGASSSQWITRSSTFSSPEGTYFLQIYYDDCSSPNAALKRVTGAPIAIRLQ